MRVLIGTDILLNYLLNTDKTEGISVLFRWIQILGAQKVIDKGSIAILTHFVKIDELVRLRGFNVIEVIPRMSVAFRETSVVDLDGNEQTRSLLMQLNLVAQGYADILVTENELTHLLAYRNNVDNRIYTIEEFLEMCVAEHREYDEMKGVVLKEVSFGTLSLKDSFFKTFIDEYQPYYFEWFKKKANDPVYVALDQKKNVHALLKLKVEGADEDYTDISPVLPPARRVKISSFKVDYTGQKLGERFLRIVFDYALKENVDEIYVTVFTNSAHRKRLKGLIQKWGFVYWGIKDNGEEVYIRKMRMYYHLQELYSYPYQKRSSMIYIMPIGGNYANMLVPSVELRHDIFDYEPFKNAIRKVVILKPDSSCIMRGATLLFYRKENKIEDCRIVASGIVDGVFTQFADESQFYSRCMKRTILSRDALHDYWVKYNGHPVVVNFLHNYSFINGEIENQKLLDVGIPINKLVNMKPLRIHSSQFDQIIENTLYEKNIIVD